MLNATKPHSTLTKNDSNVFANNLDPSNAFDRVDHNKLFKILTDGQHPMSACIKYQIFNLDEI